MKKKGLKVEEILKLHHKGLSPTQIGIDLNCGVSNISKRLLKEGIKPNRTKKTWSRKNRYCIDESYFECIDTEEKSYILGLMYADGSVHRDGFYIKMKDEDVLIKVKKALKAEQLVKIAKNGEYWAYLLSISSQKMSRDLIKQGCFINKTYTLSFPFLRKDFISHFIRGFFDGDGCLMLHSNPSQCRFDLTSASVALLQEIQKIISSMLLAKGSLRKESGKSNAWHLRYSGYKINNLLDWLYKDASIFMQRKHNKFLIYKNVHVKSDKLLENP